METPRELRYSSDHEWVLVEGDEALVGITDFAQDSLGEVVYVELPDVGEIIEAGDVFGEVESVKSVSELFMPITGEVLDINDELDPNPGIINADPYGDGWIVRIRLEDESELDTLLSAEEYGASVE